MPRGKMEAERRERMAIEPEAILQRLEEIEAELGDSSIDHYPVPNTITQGHLRRLCQGTRGAS